MEAIDLRNTAIFLDVDGTLLDIACEPREVYVPPSLQKTLARLKMLTNDALAFVSGRSLAELDRFFSPLRLAGVGVHGAEVRVSAEDRHVRLNASPLDSHLKRCLVKAARALHGVFVEDKCYALALHFRGAPQHERRLREAVTTICAGPTSGDIEIMHGRAVVEIKSGHFNKGTALRQLMTEMPFSGRRPVFAGDDKTDEDVFAVLPEFDGLGISVGRFLPGASTAVETPKQVRAWLDKLSRVEIRDKP